MNTLINSREAVIEQLLEAGYEAEASVLAPAGIVVNRGGNLADTEGFREGLWTMQDESSMLVAEVVAPSQV